MMTSTSINPDARRRLIFSEEEYQELHRFAVERGLNPKEAIMAFVRFGNHAVDSGRSQSENLPEVPAETGGIPL